jgi:hypothetical protein
MTATRASARITGMRTSRPTDEEFVREWNALPVADRRRVRRLVRLGRSLVDADEASLAGTYARFQLSRLWMRLYWVWFVPGAVIALGIASRLHPVVVGAVLVLTTQSIFAHRNIRKTARLPTDAVGSPRAHRPPGG